MLNWLYAQAVMLISRPRCGRLQNSYFNRDQLGAVIAQKQVMLNQAQNDYARRSVLGQRGLSPLEDLQHSREAVEEAQASLNASVQQLNATKALLKTTRRWRISLRCCRRRIKSAMPGINLQRTEIRSPFTGMSPAATCRSGLRSARMPH